MKRQTSDGAPVERLGVRTLYGTGWLHLAVAVKMPLTLVVLAVLSRLLTPVDFGLIGAAWIFMELGRRLSQTSIGHAIIQRRELDDRQVSAGFTLSVAIGAAVAAMLWLLAPLVGEAFGAPASVQLVRVLSTAFAVGGAGVVSEHLLRRSLRFKYLAAADLVSYTMGSGVTAISLAACGFGAWAIVWGEIVRTSIRTAAVVARVPPRPRLRLAVGDVMELAARGAGLSFIQVSDFVVRTGGHFAVGRWLGIASLGYYTRADRLASLVFEYVGGNLFEIAFPAMAQRQRQVDRLRAAYVHGVETLSLVTAPASAMIFVAAPELVAVVLGSQWEATVPVIRILVFAAPLQMCGVLSVTAVRATGGVYAESWRQATHAALVLSGAWFGARWGISGVAVAIVSAQLTAHLLMTHAALSRLGVRWRHLLRRHLPALWTLGWTVLALAPTVGWLRAGAAPVAAALAVEIVVWIVAAVAAIRLAPPPLRPTSIPWTLEHLPSGVGGTPVRCVRNGLEWLAARDDRNLRGRQGNRIEGSPGGGGACER